MEIVERYVYLEVTAHLLNKNKQMQIENQHLQIGFD